MSGKANLPPWLRGVLVLCVLAYGGWQAWQAGGSGDGSRRRNQPPVEERADKDGGNEADEDEGSLAAEERAGGHLIRKHVGQTNEQLHARLARERQLFTVSTFPDLPTAEAAVKEALRGQRNRIDRWLRGEGGDRLVLTHRMDRVVGVSLRRGEREPRPARSVRLVLVKDRRESDGYRVLTGYPQ